MKTESNPSRSVKQLREISTCLEDARAMHVEKAIGENNVRFACVSYIAHQAEAIQRRKQLEFHCKTLRRFAISRKRKCSLLPKAREVLRAIDELIEQLGKTIAAIRREYRADLPPKGCGDI